MTQNLDWFASAAIPGDLQAEIYRLEQESRTIGISEGKSHLSTSSHAVDYCIRVLRDHQAGILTTTRLSKDNVKSLIEKATESASASFADQHRAFYASGKSPAVNIQIDKKIFSKSSQEIADMLLDLEQKILQQDSRLKKVLRLQIHEVRQRKAIANSLGLAQASESTVTSVLGEVLVQDANQVEAGWDTLAHRFGDDIALNPWALSLAAESVQLLGAQQIPSGKHAVLFHPRVGTSLLSLLGQAMSAEMVQHGKSFLKGTLGQEIFSPMVSIIDDPLLKDGVASDSVDDEGVPHQTLTMAEGGTLKNYFYDIRSASREQTHSNGHGLKNGISAPPAPGATNLYLSPQEETFDGLLKKVPKIFLVRDVMGLHMADPITGEFSLGASGLWYESGEMKNSVHGVTLGGTVLDVFKNIGAVGSEVHWRGSVGAPYFLVPSMTIAGN